MQALGSYNGGKMLFLGLGTGLGSTMIVNGFVEPMELGHLPYKKGTYEDYVGRAGLERHGKKKWRRHVADVLIIALQAWWMWRALRVGALLTPQEVVLRGYFKTRRIPWRDIEAIETTSGQDEESSFVYIQLQCRDHKRARTVPGRWNTQSGADRVAAEIGAMREQFAAG